MNSTSLWRLSEGTAERGGILRLVILLLLALIPAGCDNPQSTADSLRRQISEYRAAPDDSRKVEIEKTLAKLERQVAELERRDDDRAPALRDQLTALRADYQAARMGRAMEDATNAIRGFGEAIKDVFKPPSTNDSD